ncbi:MAG: molybdopterin-binding protein, partial [Pseudomonas aeruginosa]|nr:molybdopterin-binding protein [Pseudomonas aeruginosa]
MKGPEKKRAKIAIDPSSERQMVDLQRRLLLRGGLSLGALAMLSGCRLQDGDSVDKVLWAMSRWNDRVQAWLFSRTRLAPTFDPSQVVSPFP